MTIGKELVEAMAHENKQDAESLKTVSGEGRLMADGVREPMPVGSLREKAKARLMVKLFIQNDVASPETARDWAKGMVDAMTDEEVQLVDW